MRVDPRDRLSIRSGLDDVRLFNREIAVLIPIPTDTAYDVQTDSGRDVSKGDGTGQAVDFVVYRVVANLREIDQNMIAYGHVAPGAEVGDYYFTVRERDRKIFQAAFDDPQAYLLADGETFRVFSLNTAGVGRAEEYVVTARKFRPRWRKPGY